MTIETESTHTDLKHMQLASFNVEGLTSNHAFIQSELCHIDILAIQEHWLLSFQKDKINELLPQWDSHTRCVDESNLPDNSCMPHGHGGVATMWSPWLSPFVSRKDEGNTRILVTLFDLPGAPICILNCYLPSGTSKQAVENYTEDMVVISDLIDKYKHSHTVAVMGDLNADFHNRKGKKEEMLQRVISENKVRDLGFNCKSVSTYINPHLGHSSHLDYILVEGSHNLIHWSEMLVTPPDEEASAINTSKHQPVSVMAAIPLNPEKKKVKQNQFHLKRVYSWEEADPEKFNAAMVRELKSYNLNIIPPEQAISALQHIICTATAEAVPYVDMKIKSNPKRHKKWTPHIALAVQQSKEKHYNWKEAGRPKGNHPLNLEKKEAKRAVKSAQRKEEANERLNLLNQISLASEKDQNLCHRLIRRKRGGQPTCSALMINDELVTDDDHIRPQWASYYVDLGTPADPDLEHQRAVTHMRLLCERHPRTISVTSDTVQCVIKKLQCGKAQDKNGMTAEHLKLLPPPAVLVLTNIFNRVLESRKCPHSLKTSSYKLPIPKKGKDVKNMDHYRGITVTSIFYKLLEHLWLESGGVALEKSKNGLQFGFSHGCSPSMASLIITEAVAEAKGSKQQLYIASLDARKAFDVVSQPLLLSKLFHSQLDKTLWSLIDNMYTGSEECVRWRGIDSHSYPVQQGVKQGGILSPLLYKCYINNLLETFKKSSLGLHIGNIYIGSPTVADDVLLMSASGTQLQSMLNIAVQYSTSHHYDLHPQKSVVCPFLNTHSKLENVTEWTLGENKIPVADKFTHLGLDWKAGCAGPDIDSRINAARQTAYSMLDIGVHGQSGLDPPASLRIITLYIVPRLLHGLEAAVLSRKDLSRLDNYYRGLLRQVQGLPSNTATEAIYLLLGTLPIEAHLHKRTLSLMGSIARLDARNPLKQLAVRQLAVKSSRSPSWFTQARNLATKYGIDASFVPWPKLAWKSHISEMVKLYWEDQLRKAALSKKTLQYLLQGPHPSSLPHPLWQVCRGNSFQTSAAMTRARMLVGRYPVQEILHSVYQKADSPTCQLCCTDTETLEHLIASCPSLHHIRSRFVRRLKEIYTEEGWPAPETPAEITSATLNGAIFMLDSMVDNRHNQPELSDSHHPNDVNINHCIYVSQGVSITNVNTVANLLCHKLHLARELLLAKLEDE